VFVYHGMLRLDYAKTVGRSVPATTTTAALVPWMPKTVFGELEGVTRSEPSARPSAALFIELFEQEAKRAAAPDFLAQGTL